MYGEDREDEVERRDGIEKRKEEPERRIRLIKRNDRNNWKKIFKNKTGGGTCTDVKY